MRLSSAVALVGLAATTLMAGVRAESDVIDLTAKNFASSVGDEKLMLVEFFAPWCGHCKALAPEYEIAATQLKEHGIPIAKVDCTVETELCQEQGIQGYPTLKVFREGTPSDYQGARKADAIVSFLKKQNLPALSIVSAEDLDTFSKSDKVVIVGVLPKDSEKREELEKIAKTYRDDYVFGVTEASEDVPSGSGIVLFKQFDEGKNVLDGDFDAESLTEFIKANATPVMDDIGPNNYAKYMESGLPLAYLFFATPEQKTQYSAEIEAVAKSFKGKMNFAYIDALTVENMQKLAEDVLAGKVEPSIKSEPIPESNDGPVKVVVAHTYEEIVENNKDKDVLIEFYAPWCGHCKNLAPIYEELGKAYEGSNIVIAKLDATANDLPSSVPFGIQGFPTIKFRKAGAAVDEYIDYNGNRAKEDFIQFLNENAVNKFEVKSEPVAEEKPVQAEDIEHDEL
ncbi:protein disulfide-isomerase precursor [Mortierella sp. GBA35]|nr:protein disulfide-isomerase precursor [Mortierella sp. GBA35]